MELSVQLRKKNDWTKRGERVKINFHSANEVCVASLCLRCDTNIALCAEDSAEMRNYELFEGLQRG